MPASAVGPRNTGVALQVGVGRCTRWGVRNASLAAGVFAPTRDVTAASTTDNATSLGTGLPAESVVRSLSVVLSPGRAGADGTSIATVTACCSRAGTIGEPTECQLPGASTVTSKLAPDQNSGC